MRYLPVISYTLCAVLLMTLLALPAPAQEQVFEVEALNEGLGPAPDGLDRATPQATIEALRDAARAYNFTDAAHLLDLSEFDPSEQAQEGPVLARKLHEVIDRKVVIDWEQLLDRPDALDANAPSENPVAGEAQRSIRLWLLPLEDRTVEIRINRLKTPDDPPVWVFSQQTVGNIEALHARYGPTALEQALPRALRAEAFWGMRWWEVIGLPLAILVAGLAGWATYRVLSAAAGRANRKIVRDVVKAMRAPVTIAVLTAFVAYATQRLFTFSGLIDSILSPIIVLGFVWAALHLVVNVIDAVLDRLVQFDDMDLSEIGHDQNRRIATHVAAIRRALIVIIFVVGIALVLSSARIFENLGFSLLASAGALTLLLGFAARNVLGNIMASLQIAMNQSARIGDKIKFKDYLCNVERIHFTYVQLREWTGVRLVVPVEEFVGETFENWSMNEPELTRLITLKLSHDAEVEEMRRAFFEIVEAMDQEDMGDPDGRKVAVTGHDVFGQDVTFCLPCKNPNTAWAMECECREKLIARAQDLARQGRNVFPEANPAEAA